MGDIEFQTCPEGEHVGKLKVKEVDLPVYNRTPDGSVVKDPVKTKPGFRLVFKIASIENCWVTKNLSKVVHEKGNTFSTTQNLAQDFMNDCTWDEKGYCTTPEKVWEKLLACTGKDYLLEVKLKNGKFANIINIKPYSAPSQPEKEITQEDMDDIPF